MGTAGAAAFLSLAVSTLALAADLPHRKPGVWEITSSGGATIQYCVDPAADKMMLGIAGPLDPNNAQSSTYSSPAILSRSTSHAR